MKTGIYSITNITNNKKYVGYALSLSDRKHNHFNRLRNNKHKNVYLQRSFNKHGKDKFIFEILETCEAEVLCAREHYWATLLNTHNQEFGYNIRPTHEHGFPRHAEETRLKISKTKQSRKVIISEETRQKLKVKRKERVYTNEDRRKISEGRMGMKFSQSHIENMRLARLGKENPLKWKAIVAEKEEKKIEFKSIKEASECLNLDKGSICNVLKGRSKTSGGYKFLYK